MPIRLNSTGILGGHDVHAGLVELAERRIERVGLAAAGRPGHEHHAPRLVNRALEPLERVRLEAELGHVEPQALGVEQAEHDLFAEQRRQHRHAEVDLAAGAAIVEPRLDAAVLRQPLLGDVEPRHDLDARHERIAVLQRRRHHRLQHAVDAEPHAQVFFVRLDVNVARAPLDGRQEERVGQPDDRRLAALPFERGRVDLLGAVDDLDFVLPRRGSGLRARG